MRAINVTVDFGPIDPDDDEFASVEAFVEDLVEMEQDQFHWFHLNALSYRTGRSNRDLRRELEDWGFTLAERGRPSQHRGFRSNPHDRWHGPGSCPTHGGSGWEEITGMAGQPG